MKTTRVPGIYKITNTINGKFYIGSAVNLANRFACHKRDLRGNKHHNTHLQSAWNKYGEAAFTFEVIERLESKSQLFEREQFYLDSLKPYEKGVGYNKSKSAVTCLGVKASEETRRRQSEAAKRKFQRTPPKRGEECPNAILTWKKVNEIREKYKTGQFTHLALAQEYGIDRKYVSSIIKQKNWKTGEPPIETIVRDRKKFSKEQMEQIVEEIKNGSLIKDLIIKYDTCYDTIIKTRKRYGL